MENIKCLMRGFWSQCPSCEIAYNENNVYQESE